MKLKSTIAALAVILSCAQAFGQATILPPGETCFQATTGINGMVGALGAITGGSLYTNGTYGGVALTGGSGSGATANITVSGGIVTAVTVLNPGIKYVVGDVLSATAASIGGTGSGFSVPVNSVAINSSVAGGSVGFYIPNTLTIKQTWQDSGETILNTNPVQLDQNGCAVVYGAGIYRMIVQDSLGNTVYDKLTASTGPSGIFWAGAANGTGNAITVVDSNFANQDGATIQFLAKAANTGPTTIQVSGGTIYSVVNDTSSGPAALSGGEIGPANTPMVTFDATNAEFHLVNPAATTSGGGGSSSGLTPPQGYLNLVGQATGDVVQTGDVISTTTVFYSPFVGNTIPIWNGSVFKSVTFSELTTTLTAAGSPLNSLQDECVFSNNGVPTLVTSPAWTTATPGAGNRGTGAGTPQLTRLQGIWVNAVTIIGYNGLSSFSIPANQCTYVGSVSIDGTAGQVTAHRTYGQSRKFGVWNAYNRQPIYLKAGDSTASWATSSPIGPRSSNASAANSLTVFMGLPEETFSTDFKQKIRFLSSLNATTMSAQSGIGINATGAFTGNTISLEYNSSGQGSYAWVASATFLSAPVLGLTTVNALETASPNSQTITFFGQEPLMLLSAQWRG